ncbi:MAG: hypothetical protein AAF533_20965 [Acidobacteriota bacterium]
MSTSPLTLTDDRTPVRVSDHVPSPLRVLVVAGTGLVRDEIVAACDDDMCIEAVADGGTALERASAIGPDCVVLAADDLCNCEPDELVSRLRMATSGRALPVLWLGIHGQPDLLAAAHSGADDLASWPLDADLLRARMRSMVRASSLASSTLEAAGSGDVDVQLLRQALGNVTHLINNAVAGISGRAQLAALTGCLESSDLLPVCLTETRKISQVLEALHRLAESVAEATEKRS